MRLRSVTARTASADAAFVAAGVALTVGALSLGASITPDADDVRLSRGRADAVLAQPGLPRDLLVGPLRPAAPEARRPQTPAQLRVRVAAPVGTASRPRADQPDVIRALLAVPVAPAALPADPAPVAPAPAPAQTTPAQTTPAKAAPAAQPPAAGHEAGSDTPTETTTTGRYSMLGTLSAAPSGTADSDAADGAGGRTAPGKHDAGRRDRHAEHKRKVAFGPAGARGPARKR